MDVTEFKREEIVLILESIKATRKNFEKNINQLKKVKSESLEKIIKETLESYNQIEIKCLNQLKNEREGLKK